jgi:hypothetical protein
MDLKWVNVWSVCRWFIGFDGEAPFRIDFKESISALQAVF